MNQQNVHDFVQNMVAESNEGQRNALEAIALIAAETMAWEMYHQHRTNQIAAARKAAGLPPLPPPPPKPLYGPGSDQIGWVVWRGIVRTVKVSLFLWAIGLLLMLVL